MFGAGFVDSGVDAGFGGIAKIVDWRRLVVGSNGTGWERKVPVQRGHVRS
jgi:hypothetical protein